MLHMYAKLLQTYAKMLHMKAKILKMYAKMLLDHTTGDELKMMLKDTWPPLMCTRSLLAFLNSKIRVLNITPPHGM